MIGGTMRDIPGLIGCCLMLMAASTVASRADTTTKHAPPALPDQFSLLHIEFAMLASLIAHGDATPLAADKPSASDPSITGKTGLIRPVAQPVIVASINPGNPPAPIDNNLLTRVPRLGSFDLTFYSDMPVGGFDGMYNAQLVVSLTHRF